MARKSKSTTKGKSRQTGRIQRGGNSKPTRNGQQTGRRGWSEKELATLGKMAGTRPVGIIAYELGRTESAVRNKAFAERISFGSPERSPYGKPASSGKARRKK
jgi:hypothetical protein